MHAHAATGPWVFDTRELVRRPGSMKTFSRVVQAPDPIGTDVIAIAPGQPVEVELRMESVVEGVLATGSARATATGVCVRCLDPVEQDVDVTFQELFAYTDRAAHHHEVADAEDEDEQYELQGDLMDLESVVRDAVVTALPFQPVCRDDCPGLCSECGAHLADNPDHHHDVIDPRWSALSELAQRDDTDDEKRN
jgi:uncharacterized protein